MKGQKCAKTFPFCVMLDLKKGVYTSVSRHASQTMTNASSDYKQVSLKPGTQQTKQVHYTFLHAHICTALNIYRHEGS